MSLETDQLTVGEADEVVSVCASISNVPEGGLDSTVTVFLSASQSGDKPGTCYRLIQSNYCESKKDCC